jgi:hypothetical protein
MGLTLSPSDSTPANAPIEKNPLWGSFMDETHSSYKCFSRLYLRIPLTSTFHPLYCHHPNFDPPSLKLQHGLKVNTLTTFLLSFPLFLILNFFFVGLQIRRTSTKLEKKKPQEKKQ